MKVGQSCRTLCDSMDYTVHGILQARTLEWAAFPFSSESSQPRDQIQVSCIAGRFFTSWATDEQTLIGIMLNLWIKLGRTGTLLLSRFSRVRLCATPWQPTRIPYPWDSPGKNTGVGCHFLLQCIKVKSESEVTQSCPTLQDPMDCSLPGSSIHGIFQARVLEWGAIAFSDCYFQWMNRNISPFI